MAGVADVLADVGEITGDSAFPELVRYWLDGLRSEGELATSALERYAWEAEHLLLPAFAHWACRGPREGVSTPAR